MVLSKAVEGFFYYGATNQKRQFFKCEAWSILLFTFYHLSNDDNLVPPLNYRAAQGHGESAEGERQRGKPGFTVLRCNGLRGVSAVLVSQRRTHLPQQQCPHDRPKQREPGHGWHGQEWWRSLSVLCQTWQDVCPGLCSSHTGRSEFTVRRVGGSSACAPLWFCVHSNCVYLCICKSRLCCVKLNPAGPSPFL